MNLYHKDQALVHSRMLLIMFVITAKIIEGEKY